MKRLSALDTPSLESLAAEVADDFRQRRQRGENPCIDEYVRRYPQAEAVVRDLLTSLELLAASAPGSAKADVQGLINGALGDFRLLREVGRGGMGVVYEAEQISLNRRVALKVLPFAATLDPRHLQRFKNEAMAAANLDHPNIVAVHGVGCERGVHFYAMKFIDGQTLAEVIATLQSGQPSAVSGQPEAKRELSPVEATVAHDREGEAGEAPAEPQTRENLEPSRLGRSLALPSSARDPAAETVRQHATTVLGDPHSALHTERSTFFQTVARLGADVAEALDHAHQQGVIHRDIKPSNLMVQVASSLPTNHYPLTTRIWITDFGLAHVQGDKSVTMTGDLVGTVRYMSPEQALAKRVPLDHRTDVYSLGVTLYELLTLQSAFQGRDRHELLRQIAFEDPKPPRRINKSIPAELETIVLKAIEKNPADRYATAQEMAADLQRYLKDEPIRARRPGAVQKVRKWGRRHPSVVWSAVAALFVAALSLTAALIAVEHERGLTEAERVQTAAERDRAERESKIAQAERDRAERESEIAKAERDRAERETKIAQGERDRAERERKIADAVRRFLQEDLLLQADAEQQSNRLHASGEWLLETGENPTVRELLDRTAAALSPDIIEEKFPGQPIVQAAILETVGKAYSGVGGYSKAISHLNRANALYEAELGTKHADTLHTIVVLAVVYQKVGQWERALELYERALARRKETLGPDHEKSLIIMGNIAVLHMKAGHPDKGLQLCQQTLAKMKKTLGPIHPTVLATMANLAASYCFAGHPDKALPLLKESLAEHSQRLGPDHPHTLTVMNNLGNAYKAVGQTDKALRLHEQTLAKRVEELGPDHPDTLDSMDELADTYRAAGQVEKGMALFEESLTKRTEKLGRDHPDTLKTMNRVGVAYWSIKKLDRSIPLFEEAYNLQKARIGPNHPDTLNTMANLGQNYLDAGRMSEGLPLLEQGQALAHKHTVLAWVAENLALAYEKAQQFEKAEPLLRDVVDRVRKKHGDDDPRTAAALAVAGSNLLKQGKHTRAEPLLRECLATREKQLAEDWRTFNTRSMLGGALAGQKKYVEAEPLLLEGYAGMIKREAKIPPQGKIRVTEALERLVQLYDAWGKQAEAAQWRTKLEMHKAKLKAAGEK